MKKLDTGDMIEIRERPTSNLLELVIEEVTGRVAEAWLTPDEARQLAIRLIVKADRVDARP